MKAYYAHCTSIFNTPQEERDLKTLKLLGWDVFNPNCEKCSKAYKKEGMEYFRRLVQNSGFGVVVFRALPDGSIPCGIYKEVRWAKDKGIPVVELPSCLSRRELDMDETMEFLYETGQR